MTDEPRIVEAVGSASGRQGTKGEINRAVERAMSEAVLACYKEAEAGSAEAIAAGFPNALHPDYIRQRKMEARERVKAAGLPTSTKAESA